MSADDTCLTNSVIEFRGRVPARFNESPNGMHPQDREELSLATLASSIHAVNMFELST